MTRSQAFTRGFWIGLFSFFLANVLAAHLHSDCGLPAVLGASACADDIVRAGFPFIFLEEGDFAFRHNFNLLYLLVDIFIGFGFATACGILTGKYTAKSTRKISLCYNPRHDVYPHPICQ